MVADYRKYFIDTVKEYIYKNKVYQCYSFLLQNIDFVNNFNEKFKFRSITRAYELIEECDYKINNSDSENFKNKILNIRTILTQYLSHFD